MILTVCFFVFNSLVAVTPVSEACFYGNETELRKVGDACSAVNHDPLTTCEIQRMSPARYYVRVRSIAADKSEAPPTPAPKPVEAALWPYIVHIVKGALS